MSMENFSLQKNEFCISTDKSKLDIDAIHEFLATKAYWCLGIPKVKEVYILSCIEMKKNLVGIFILFLIILYCSSYLHKRINHEMVRNKFDNEIRCQLKPSIDGPSLLLIQANIESNGMSKEEKQNEMKKQMDAIVVHYAEIEQQNNFNRKAFWVLRKTEEFIWNLVTETN